MSSKDKTGNEGKATDAEATDRNLDDINTQSDKDDSAVEENLDQAPQDPEDDTFSRIEDAEIIGETPVEDDAPLEKDESFQEEVDPATAPETEPDSPYTPWTAEAPADDTPDETYGETDKSDEPVDEIAAADVSDTAAGSAGVPIEPTAVAPPPPPPPPPQKSGGGFFPAVLGGLIAAGVGFGAAQYMGGDLFGKNDAVEQAISTQGDKLAGLDGKLTDLESKLGELSTALTDPAEDTVKSDLTALGDRLSTQVGDVATGVKSLAGTIGTMQSSISDLETKLGALDSSLSDVNDRLSAVEKRPLTESSEAAKQAFAAYERDLENLRTQLNEQTKTNDALAKELEARAQSAKDEVAAAAKRAAELQKQAEEQAKVAAAQAESRTRAAAVREAMASLDASIETGTPFAAALKILGQGVDVPAPLTAAADTGVTSLPQLQDSFPELARQALDASIRETVDDDMANRAIAFLRAQTGVRSLTPHEGDDPDAVLSRAEAALDEGDLSTSLTELKKLPPSGQAVMADWIAKAQTRLEVTEAAKTLANTPLAN